jgi:hypothetical protein
MRVEEMFYDRDTFYRDKEFGLEFDLLYEFENNQVEEDEMGGPCNTNGGEEEPV